MKIRKSLSTKIILMVEAILLFSSAVFCAVSISRASIGIRQAIQQRMVDIANCAAGSVKGDVLENLKPGDENTAAYRTVYDTMAVFRDNAEIEYIYAIRDEGNGKFTFIADTDPDEPASFGDEVQYTEALNRAAKGKTSVDEVPYSDAWGQFYSAYSPVFDSAGRVAGIVAADFSVEWYDAQMQEQTLSNVRSYLVILITTILGAAVLCFMTVRPYVKQQEQLLEEKVTAESANRAKSEFLTNMSHEIRTPINAVLGMNEMILRESRQGTDLSAERAAEARNRFGRIISYANMVENAGKSLLAIVNGILDFSKIEAGRMELVRVRYHLKSLLNDVSDMFLLKAQEKGLTFTVCTDESLPDSLYGDEIRVREIITNILQNAVKYTDHGYVRLTVRAGEQTGDRIRLIITVEDSGIGIRRQDMDRLFHKFERLDMERNSTAEGSGLGLVITRSLLEMMGGTIRVESEYGKGSVFTIEIPQQIAAEAEDSPVPDGAATPEMPESFHAPKARILVVDDTKINLTVTVSLLSNTEIRIDTAGSGTEAVALAKENAYDIIFMDQRMPEMDGTEALHRIRQMPDSPNSGTPIICLTADAITGARERYLAEGFTDYLAKPVDSRKLGKILLKYLPEEKVIPVSAEKEDRTENRSPVRNGAGDAYEALHGAEINTESGLYYCQNEQLYRTLLMEYAGDYPEKADKIRRSFEQEDWKNYAIQVHSLKSSSRMLGAGDLSDRAACLEAAANEGNTDLIRQEHTAMMNGYGKVIRAIRDFLRFRGGDSNTETDQESEVLEFLPEDPVQDAGGERLDL